MKYTIINLTPVRFLVDGKDKAYFTGDEVELNPNDNKTKKALSLFNIIESDKVVKVKKGKYKDKEVKK